MPVVVVLVQQILALVQLVVQVLVAQAEVLVQQLELLQLPEQRIVVPVAVAAEIIQTLLQLQEVDQVVLVLLLLDILHLN
jgi:hypothetical protein